jgi:hypothetical protein
MPDMVPVRCPRCGLPFAEVPAGDTPRAIPLTPDQDHAFERHLFEYHEMTPAQFAATETGEDK